jgi:very-short-patch-repair endonuclease
MSSHSLAPGCVSKRSVSIRLGLNIWSINLLIKEGILISSGYGILEDSLSNLIEGRHFVTCHGCGLYQGEITSKHTVKCCGLTLPQYKERWPNSLLVSELSKKKGQKTESQRKAQSEKLILRFQTEAGDITRHQISEAAQKLQASEYRVRASDHLRALNSSPERRAQISREGKERWLRDDFRAKMAAINASRRQEVLKSAAHARGYLIETFTKPHRLVEDLLVESGLQFFMREYPIGYYHVDEALPEIKLAIEVDGCYWHGCQECGLPPRGDVLYLDRSKSSYLAKHGWLLVRIKEHEILRNPTECLLRVQTAIKYCGGSCGS